MVRKRGRGALVLLLLLCMTLGSCAGGEWLDEVPKDFALWKEEAASATGDGAGILQEGQAVSGEEGGPDAVTEPPYSFLAEEVYGFAFFGLTEAEKIWYRDMEQILGCHQEKKQLSPEGLEAGLDETDIDRVFQSVLIDHPELFYVEGYSYTRFTRGEKITALEFSGSYNVDLETAKIRQEEIARAVGEILSGIAEEATDYEKVKYVYDTLIRNTEYELDSPDNQNIYSVFVNHISVCQGYAKATQHLLNALGIPCTLVLGTVGENEGHAWNLVNIGGSCYYVDTTWGDASYQLDTLVEESQLSMPEINYDYLNVTTAELLRTHTISPDMDMPLCIDTAANYYVMEGALFSSYDRQQMEELFQRAIEEGREDVTIKCADEESYVQVMTALLDNQEIFRYLKESDGTVAYTRDDNQRSLTFWVTNE